jgi:hypothetical protein
MRANRRSLLLTSLIALAVVTVVGCAGSGAAAPPPLAGQGGTGGSDSFRAAPSAAATAAPDQAPGEPANGPVAPDQVGNLVDDAKIVRTGRIELQVGDVPAALITARDRIRALGGYIGASQTQNVDDRPVATVTYRVPVARWEDALDLLRGIAGPSTKVLDEQTQALEVTGQAIDLEARIKNLRASEAALQGISSRAARVSDVLEVQNQLTAVRGQIEELTAQLTHLNDQAAYATLEASFSMPVVAVQAAAERWEPTKVVDQATASLVDIVQALTTAGIWFAIVWLPILLVVGVVGFAIVTVLRRLGVIGPRRRGDVAAIG